MKTVRYFFYSIMMAKICGLDAFATAMRSCSIVTGANGYLGKEIISELLRQNEDARPDEIICLVRPSRVSTEETHWADTPCVRVMPYDMLDGGHTLSNALKVASGSENACNTNICIYHVASVFGPTANHEQTALDNVKGTEDVVKTIAECSSEKCQPKLIVTSSMAAVRASGQDPLNGEFYTSDDWNTMSKLGVNWGASYQWSKAESERRARDLSEELKVPMASICPSFIFGPPSSQDSNSFSIQLVGQWVRGESDVQSRLCVDVRDVAKAHVAAMLSPNSMGKRYIVSSEARIPSQNMADALKRICKDTGMGDPDKISFDADFDGGAIKIGDKECECAAKLKDEFGLVMRSVEETMADMGEVLLKMGKPSS
eukprot:CAMPEP_0195302514 /NCGR_PEP_ID=MMETSP0707-20130614/31222_1 /TAXON_ID=33640 /ORGANISM="Asterionellopsis glacialis, Strain CCMP134" /LENGTH=371 /DNA_ID=CAMNT_0040365791 /DNA_START=38 /DNA_END=1153 /DNA_ORIENTATION=-